MTDLSLLLSHPIEHLLRACGGLRSGEDLLVIADDTTEAIVPIFADCAAVVGANVTVATVPVADRHGVEPSDRVAALMERSHLIVGLTKMSMAHTRARQIATAKQARYLSLPGYSESLLSDPCILADYRGQYPLTRAISDAFTAGEKVHLTAPGGTDLWLEIGGRTGNCCPGFVDDENRLGSPPDIEANVSPIETASSGVAVVDGSVACEDVGLLSISLRLEICEGKITKISSESDELRAKVERVFERVGDPKAYVLAECGVGLNPLARLTGNMLTDEGTLGCVHLGFGSNITVGGANDVPFHLDFVIREASLSIDDVVVLERGVPRIREGSK